MGRKQVWLRPAYEDGAIGTKPESTLRSVAWLPAYLLFLQWDLDCVTKTTSFSQVEGRGTYWSLNRAKGRQRDFPRSSLPRLGEVERRRNSSALNSLHFRSWPLKAWINVSGGTKSEENVDKNGQGACKSQSTEILCLLISAWKCSYISPATSTLSGLLLHIYPLWMLSKRLPSLMRFSLRKGRTQYHSTVTWFV